MNAVYDIYKGKDSAEIQVDPSIKDNPDGASIEVLDKEGNTVGSERKEIPDASYDESPDDGVDEK